MATMKSQKRTSTQIILQHLEREKGEFAKQEVKFIGHIVGSGNLNMDLCKTRHTSSVH